MDIFRLHTNAEGLSILETIAVPMTAEDEQGHFAATFPAADMTLCETENGFFQSWHNSPRRQMVIILSGMMEIELRDGTSTCLKAGQVLLAEDIHGSGHKTRAGCGESLHTAIIPLE